MDVIDIVERAGLYWLKWRKTIHPVRAASNAASDPATSIAGTPVASDQVLGQAPSNLSSGSHASSSKFVERVPGVTQKTETSVDVVTEEATKQLLGAEEAYRTNPSAAGILSADGSGGKAQLVEENSSNDSRTLDDSYELNQMELAVDQYCL